MSTIPDSHADAAGVATLSTLGADGHPQVTACGTDATATSSTPR